MSTSAKLFNDLYGVGLGVYIKSKKTLVVADSHLGYEDALSEQGIFVPRVNFALVKKEIQRMLKSVDVERVVFNGDLKHEFGEITKQEWRETIELIEFIKKKADLVLIKGNHDTILKPIANKVGLKLIDSFIVGDYLITHGHSLIPIPKKIKGIIIAHEHPAISLREKGTVEKFKCFLAGNFKRVPLLVIPSLLQVVEGTDVLKEDLLSPYLNQDISDFDVWIVEDKIYYFGKIKNLKSLRV